MSNYVGAIQETIGGELDQTASSSHIVSGINCNGQENSLQECSVTKWGRDGACQSSFAGVVCESKLMNTC